MANDQILTAEQVVERASLYLQPEEAEFIHRAFKYAEYSHREQFRKSGSRISFIRFKWRAFLLI